MNLELNEKVILISGGGKGIGEAISRTLAAEGAIPVLVDKSLPEAEGLRKDIIARGGRASVIHQELGSPESCRKVVEEALGAFGRIDGLVNNAGVNDGVGLESGSPEAWLHSLTQNLHHYYYLAHYATKALIASRGAIVNIASKTALTGQGNTSAYAAAKGAQLALTREWAVELAKYGIRVNAIVPSEVMTPMYRTWIDTFDQPDQKLREIENRIPLEGRMTTPQEIADMAAFLLSARASHITGQHLFVDGGYVHLDRSISLLDP